MHYHGTHEGKGRGSDGKQGVGSRLTKGNKKILNGGFGDRITSFLSDTAESAFWSKLCEDGHRYHISTGVCIHCGAEKED